MTDTQWLTVEQIAERLQFHPDTVRRLLREGKISGHRISRRGGWRARPSEVDRFVTHGEGNQMEGKTDQK